MDSNISDLIGGVLSNPEMMNKVKTLLPIVSQMMKTDGTAETPAASQPVQPPADNIMANENVAAAIQNLIAALNAANQNNQNNNEQPSENAVPVFAQQQSEPAAEQQPAAPPLNADAINIEKTLATLTNVSKVASPENDHRAKLLLSLKPFLNDSRKIKIDTAIKYINAAKIFSSFGKNGFI